MGVAYNSSVTTSGLILCTDAGNLKSYAGSGTTLRDISTTKLTGTMNTVTVSNSVMVFNGSGYVDLGTSLTSVDTTDKTMVAWIYPTAWNTGTVTGILDKDIDAPFTPGGWGFWMQDNGKQWFWPSPNQDIQCNGSLTAALNTWTMIATTYNATTKTCNFYYNASLGSTVTNASASPASSSGITMTIGTFRNNAGGRFNGSMGPVMLYNRVLTATEITKNFNAHRGRFGV